MDMDLPVDQDSDDGSDEEGPGTTFDEIEPCTARGSFAEPQHMVGASSIEGIASIIDGFYRQKIPWEEGDSILSVAAGTGIVTLVNFLLDHSADVNLLPNGHWKKSALMAAAGFGRLHVIRLLYDRLADLNLTDSSNMSALAHASDARRPRTARLLIDLAADINAGCSGRYPFGKPPLLSLSRFGYLELVALALEKRANAHITVEYGANCVEIAARHGKWEVVQLLLAHRVSPNTKYSKETPLSYAMRYGHMKKHNFVQKHGARLFGAPSVTGKSVVISPEYDAFCQDIQRRKMELVTLLLDHAANLDDACNGWNQTPLIMAAKAKDNDLVRLLIGRRADVNARSMENLSPLNCHCEDECACEPFGEYAGGKTALMAAAESGSIELVCLLVGCHANVNAFDNGGTNALLIAAEKKEMEVMRFLVEAAAELNHRDRYGGSALLSVLREGQSEDVAHYILATKADVTVRDQDGSSVLAAAAHRNYWGLVHKLLDQKALPNGTTCLDETPLMLAVQAKCIDATCSLLKAKANMKAKDIDGNRALGLAVQNGSLEIVQLLLDQRANLKAARDAHRTPLLHTAIEQGNVDITRLLIERKANMNARDNWDGLSPMARAIERGSLESVRLLVETRANLRSRVDGISLMDFAGECHQHEIKGYLRSVGSQKFSR